MFNEMRYNLQALNKRFEFMEKTVQNVLKLKGDRPFDESEEAEEEKVKIEDPFLEDEPQSAEKDLKFHSKIKSPKRKSEKEKDNVIFRLPVKNKPNKSSDQRKKSASKNNKFQSSLSPISNLSSDKISSEDGVDSAVKKKKLNKFQE